MAESRILNMRLEFQPAFRSPAVRYAAQRASIRCKAVDDPVYAVLLQRGHVVAKPIKNILSVFEILQLPLHQSDIEKMEPCAIISMTAQLNGHPVRCHMVGNSCNGSAQQPIWNGRIALQGDVTVRIDDEPSLLVNRRI
ncbi:hypothetical protein CN884_06780 [Ochrobactrum sp. 30A/1000/2015]|nr:hypothetical protein A7J42_07115 [Brucella intermedia]PJT24631.1 hypothetical protein CN884_06780 [Ochrobactrum sp. 30A/1000/2015]PJT36626.1 hypothetical protein CN883_22425 [Ochrobactrum sp. 27A/999/2015]PJT42007.1 hypothetical protein CN882_20565 [Ochrobactrum sp. 23A/997/2015]